MCGRQDSQEKNEARIQALESTDSQLVRTQQQSHDILASQKETISKRKEIFQNLDRQLDTADAQPLGAQEVLNQALNDSQSSQEKNIAKIQTLESNLKTTKAELNKDRAQSKTTFLHLESTNDRLSKE
ncbi:hypothetical protein IMSHALPRED_008345 [Imshaugia aleurites]|uniref:Uncharacterized protein n=1 Tax=Imshaugia aleurites TaxID=172621 RepID=A0A8H3IRX2_9LECA|nr:hypothetical protein IMSHALPRED_008345 [Imshaugia aleurites]